MNKSIERQGGEKVKLYNEIKWPNCSLGGSNNTAQGDQDTRGPSDTKESDVTQCGIGGRRYCNIHPLVCGQAETERGKEDV